jgi:hypothetical protein
VELSQYPDYFTCWEDPDAAGDRAIALNAAATAQARLAKRMATKKGSKNAAFIAQAAAAAAAPIPPRKFVVQRTMVSTPEVSDDEVLGTVPALVPQGGIDADRLLRRLPPAMQRYFFRHGLKTTLRRLSTHFVVVGERVLCIEERD